MTKEDLIKEGKHKVRENKSLMLEYIRLFKEHFGYEPNCAGCTFSNDWEKFIQSNKSPQKTTTKTKQMSNNKYVLKRFYRSEILTYYEGNRPRRVYGNKITDEFAENYLKNGTEQEIKERREKFEKLPETETKKPETKKAQSKKGVEKKEEVKEEDKNLTEQEIKEIHQNKK